MKHISSQSMASAAVAALIVPSSIPRAMERTFNFGIRAEAQSPEAMFNELRTALNELRNTVDTTINGRVDIITAQREERLNETISNLSEAMQALQQQVDAGIGIEAGVIGDIPGNPEYVANFRQHMRNGVGDQIGSPVQAAMQIGVDADGGYTAPVEWDRSITQALIQVSPIRANAETISISTRGFSRLFAIGQPGSGWVGETAARPQTTTPQFVPLTFDVGELYANPAITQQALDDSAINLEEWLSGSVRDEFGRQENIAFLAGNGVNKPFGILTYVTGAANAAKHPLGAIETVAAAGAAAITPDDLLNVVYAMPAERIANAKWFLNRLSEGALRKVKDTTGQYIWTPGMVAGAPSTLYSYETVNVPGMPTIATGAISALFGDMRATYLVIDRVGIRVLRDPYTNKPYVMFYTTKRVGGGVQNPEYMKALKQA